MSFFAAIVSVAAEPTVAALRARQQVSEDAAAAAARASLRAAGWFDDGRYLTDAALARAAAGGTPHQLPTAEALVARALAGQPASPFNWTRLAVARREAGDMSGAMRAWEMSVLTGRYVPGLMAPRLGIGLELLPSAGAEQVALLGDQVRLIAGRDATALAVAARRTRAEAFVRAALVSTPDLLAAYNAAREAARG